jgi:hypothetical protein
VCTIYKEVEKWSIHVCVGVSLHCESKSLGSTRNRVRGHHGASDAKAVQCVIQLMMHMYCRLLHCSVSTSSHGVLTSPCAQYTELRMQSLPPGAIPNFANG